MTSLKGTSVYGAGSDRAYYYAGISIFLNDDSNRIIGALTRRSFGNTDDQRDAWVNQIDLLKDKLRSAGVEGDIIFEYNIIRLGKRIDVILLIRHMVFSIEFKNGATCFNARDAEQAEDYALDLKNFHQESKDLYVCPILVATKAPKKDNQISTSPDFLVSLQYANAESLLPCIEEVASNYGSSEPLDFSKWFNSPYFPTPTIVQAAVESYRAHDVKDIAHSEAGANGIAACEKEVARIIDDARKSKKKAMVFITGVPGAGKTLVGLNIAIDNMKADTDERAVYLSGNLPLVEVLREALKKSILRRAKEEGDKTVTSSRASEDVKAFIQAIYGFRAEYVVKRNSVPPENVVIFDEAQRCWDAKQLADWSSKRLATRLDKSEPYYLIEAMNRKDWAVIVCLVGLGQDINKGEVGINEWFASAMESFPDWDLYYSKEMLSQDEDRNIDVERIKSYPRAFGVDGLHLTTGIRSFRSSKIASFVDALLAQRPEEASRIYQDFIDKYPLYVTRNLEKAKSFVRSKVRGSERSGLLAASSSGRLTPVGIFIPKDLDVTKWFLADKEDPRSSNMLELAASEFKVQGLEVDYALLAWDADLRSTDNGWSYYRFRGNNWNRCQSEESRRYMVNSYRVLLTRARQGMVIFVPEGVDPEIDQTRDRKFYDETYGYLRSCGIRELK